MAKTWAERQSNGSYKLVSDFDPEPNKPWIERVVERLVGQCMLSIEQLMEDEGVEQTPEDEAEVCERVFWCNGCGWCCDVEELNNDNPDGRELCDECVNENGND